jgi:hypothetical protein
MISRLLIFVSICLALYLGGGTLRASSSPSQEVVVDLIPHPGGTAMMTLHSTVAGHEGNFLFDTGGGISYISPGFAQTIGCKPWGQITGFTLTGQRLDMPRCDNLSFDIKGHRFGAPISGVFDIMKYLPANVPRIDGSIGLDVFVGRAITLKLAQKRLTIESQSTLRRRMTRGKEVPIRLVREAGGVALTVYVGVPTPEGMAWMEIDSGNGGANVIGKHLAALLKLDPRTKEPQPASFTIAGGVPVGGMARVNETLIMDGNIGARFLLKWDLTLDLAHGRAWLAPAP